MTDRLEGRGRGHHRMQGQEGSSSRSGAERGPAAAPGFPPAYGSSVQELPDVGEPERTCARSPCPGLHGSGNPRGDRGPSAREVRCQAVNLLRFLTRFENPLNQGLIWMP